MHLESEHFIVDKDKSDYFEELWEHYQGKKYFWCIYRRVFLSARRKYGADCQIDL